ncbi:MAG: SusC/RagA family TonB-linked outer membrane protein [Chitinophagaceae bacterium]|nr:MAG: SusC/RagA family TonB-linked outer membrane protein [Chitinophagaceae bacterium]
MKNFVDNHSIISKNTHMRKTGSLLAVLMLLCSFAFAQTRTVSGKVTGDKGEGIPYATVTETGTKNASLTDANGLFTIKIKDGSTLTISSANYEPSIVTPGTGLVSVSLKLRDNALDEVVVTTAMGAKARSRELGYSTAKVSATQIQAGKSFNLGQALSGKAAGLTVYNTSNAVNATPRIVLRGTRSITGDNTALIVLDGVPVPANTINYINPNDVEDVTILKGGAAATLYGSDGVNGAILITTRKGTNRKPEVTFSHSSNVESVAYLPKTQHEFGSGSAYGANRAENFHPAENQQYGDAYDGSLRPLGRTLADGSIFLVPYSDIADVREKIWDKGYTAQSDISYRAGDENSQFYFSYQNVYSSGIVPGDKYYKNSLRMNGSRSYGKLRLSFDATYTWDHADRTNTDFYFFALNNASWVPLDQLKDWQNNKFATLGGYFNDYYNSPWWQLDNRRWDTKNNYFNGNVSLNYKFNSNLDLTYRLSIANTQSVSTTPSNNYVFSQFAQSYAYLDYYNANYDYILTGRGRSVARTPVTGSLGDSYSNGNRINSDVYLNYNKQLGDDFMLRAKIGNNIQVRTGKSISTSTAGLLFPDLYTFSNSLNGLYSSSNSITEQRKVGNYADAMIGYRNFLFLHGTFRYDLSSVFYQQGRAKDNYSFTYYGGDVSVVLTDAIPSIKNDVLSFAKIRGGWNRNGNDNLSPYSLQTIYGNASGFPYNGLVGQTIDNTLRSVNLKPEIVNSSEAAIELGFWKNRLNLEAVYYNQKSENQILQADISSASGYPTYLLNAANITNKGYEFDLKFNVIKSKDWNLNLNVNYSHNTNVVNGLYAQGGLNSLQFQADNVKGLYAEVGQMFPYLKTTAYLRDSATGKIIIFPEDGGWPRKGSSFVGQGNTAPKNVMGVGVNVSYKGFTLIANAEYRGDYLVYHDLGEDMMFTGTSAITTLYHRSQFLWPNSVVWDGSKYVNNTDVAVNQYNSNYYGIGDLSNGNSFIQAGELMYSSGDFWKLRDVSLTYDFAPSVIRSLKVVKGISLTVWGRNLKTWLAKDNYFTDPEFSNTSGNSIGINTSINTPPTKQYGATLRVTL